MILHLLRPHILSVGNLGSIERRNACSEGFAKTLNLVRERPGGRVGDRAILAGSVVVVTLSEYIHTTKCPTGLTIMKDAGANMRMKSWSARSMTDFAGLLSR